MYIKHLWKASIDENAWQQAKRMTLGATLGWCIASMFDLPYGAFYGVYPLVLLGFIPIRTNAKITTEFLASTVFGLMASGFLVAKLSSYPILMLLCFTFFSWLCFKCMVQGLFIFGASSVCILTSIVHLASYDVTSWNALFYAQITASIISVIVSYLAFLLFPDKAKKLPPPSPPHLTRTQLNHRVWLGTICCCMQFIVFQSLSLSDSFGAQIATILVLMSLRRDMIWISAQKRLLGVFTSCCFVIFFQLIVNNLSHIWLITLIFYIIGMLIFCTEHAREGVPGKGFPGTTTIAILYGSLTPMSNQIGESIYRAISITLAVCLMLLCVNMTHYFLNQFKSTRWV